MASNICGFGEAGRRWLAQLKPDPLYGGRRAEAMNERRFLRASIAAPIAAPCFAWILIALGYETLFGALLVSSLVLGGIPYALSAIAAVIYLRSRDLHHYYRLALFAPLLFGPILALFFQLTDALGTPSWEVGAIVRLLAWSCGFSVIFGYLYVAAVILAAKAFTPFEGLRKASPESAV